MNYPNKSSSSIDSTGTQGSEPACFGAAPAPGKSKQKFGFFLNWQRIVWNTF